MRAGADAMPRGTVYGTLMNFRSEHDALGAAMHGPPYGAPPQAPVLYVKPANTWSLDGADIPVPAQAGQVSVGATVALVLGAGGVVAGHRLMLDVSLPHASFHRPPVKFNCLDGFLGVGPRVVAPADAGDPGALELAVTINGQWRQTVRFSQLVRPAARLLADVGEFMTLGDGDSLMLGCDVPRPLARIGDRIVVSSPVLGTLAHTLVAAA